MRRNLLLVLLVFSFVCLFSRLGFSQVNEYILEPVDLQVSPVDSIVQVNINIKAIDNLKFFVVPLFAEGTSNPVLDTVLTGGLSDPFPPAFDPPSLFSEFGIRIVQPYGPPANPLLFLALGYGGGEIRSGDSGLYCRMFYKVSGPGTLTFRTAIHSIGDTVGMWRDDGYKASINWPTEGQVGSFEITVGEPVNEFSLVPIDLQTCRGCDSTIQVNVNIKTVDYQIESIVVPLFAEGTCNPVLDTMLTGGVLWANPPAFYAPSLADHFTIRWVNPYGPPADPMEFVGWTTDGGIVYPSEGLFCRMFYRVSGPGTLTFRTAIRSLGGPASMSNYTGSLPVNWPSAGEVGSFTVTQLVKPRGNVNCDELINVQDVVYLVSYLFRGGPPPHPLENGDLNCDGKVTVSDVLYLVNYLFKGGPPPPC
jgi:hypothetical protein